VNRTKQRPEPWTGRLIGQMHNHCITFADLAEKLGVGKAYVSMILNGTRNTPGMRERMEEAVEELIKEKDDAQDLVDGASG